MAGCVEEVVTAGTWVSVPLGTLRNDVEHSSKQLHWRSGEAGSFSSDSITITNSISVGQGMLPETSFPQSHPEPSVHRGFTSIESHRCWQREVVR